MHSLVGSLLSLTAYWLRQLLEVGQLGLMGWYRRKRTGRSSRRRRFSRNGSDGGRRNSFAILAVGSWSSFPATNSERVFPLLGQTFRVNVVIPYHQRFDERVWHSAASKRKAGEAFVTAICLADKDTVAPLCEWSATTR